MVRKFITYFYVKVLRIVFTIVESVSVQLQNTQLNFCKAQDIISCTKVFITSVRNDARFEVCGVEF